METRSPAGVTAPPAANDGSTRRKRRNGVEVALRYFLPKPGSSPGALELGQEVLS